MLWPASEVQRHFSVAARYYAKPVAGVPELLRDRLEIVSHELVLAEAILAEPDLLVVMMNPGASRPLDAMWEPVLPSGFVAAQPDRTQYQIMRLMLAASQAGLAWRHARVLNLSDLRTPKSAEFIQKLTDYRDDDSHSIFSARRSDERKSLFATLRTPVLFGWGMNAAFGDLARRAIAASIGHPVLGISGDGLLYRHPLPQRHDHQVAWLAEVSAQMQRLSLKTP